MKDESGPASWTAAALPIDAVLAAYIEHPTIVWLDRRKLTRHKCDSLSMSAKQIASHSFIEYTPGSWPSATCRVVAADGCFRANAALVCCPPACCCSRRLLSQR